MVTNPKYTTAFRENLVQKRVLARAHHVGERLLFFSLCGTQEVVDDMSLAGCSNLNSWVGGLDKKVEGVLAKRLEKVGTEQWFGPLPHLMLLSRGKRILLDNVYREPWFDLVPHLIIPLAPFGVDGTGLSIAPFLYILIACCSCCGESLRAVCRTTATELR